MSERQINLELAEKLEKIAKEIAKGNDVYITKSASGVVVKKMSVQKVWFYEIFKKVFKFISDISVSCIG